MGMRRRATLLTLASLSITAVLAQEADTTSPRIESFSLESKVFSNRREIRVALPPSYDSAEHRETRYPVFYLNDGFAVFKPTLWNAPATALRLMREGKIPEIILVGIDNGATATGGSPAQRTLEYLPFADTIYAPSDSDPLGHKYPDFLLEEVMPAVSARYRVKAGAAHTTLGGASLGGLAALYVVMQHPGVFGGLMLESTPTFIADSRILQEAHLIESWPARVYLGIGTKETENVELNSGAIPRCKELAMVITRMSPSTRVDVFVGEGDAHNAKAWSRRFPQALQFLFGSPIAVE
jgi:enterochelin esterase-like enzyme